MMNRRTQITGITAITLLAASLTARKQGQRGEETGQALLVMVVSSQPIELEEAYSASIRGWQDVNIISQVSGRITRLCVKKGERIRTGRVLAVIDQTPYQVALRIAIANVSAAWAKVETTRIELNGKQLLFDEKVISDYKPSVARNQLVVAQAELEQAKAQEANVRDDLSYTEIESPSNGVIGTLPYRIGVLVSPTIEQPSIVVAGNSEMYVYFFISGNKFRQLKARYGSTDRIISEIPPISLQPNNGSVYGKQGKIEIISGIVNPTTGAAQVKALFPNVNGHLLNGTIGNAILRMLNMDAILIPMTVTVELQDKIIAYRLKNGKAEVAYLTVDRLNDGNHSIVEQGLSVGNTPVTEGMGQPKEGIIVTPKTTKPRTCVSP